MDLSNVDVEKIYDIIEEISSIIANINNEGEKISSSCDSLIQNCMLLNDYNLQDIVGSKKQKQVMKDQNGEQIYSHTEVTWKEWNISGCDTIISKSETIIKMITDIENAATSISNLVSNSQLTTVVISNYIEKVNENMDSLTQEQRQILLDTFKDYKAEDEYSAMSGNYVGVKPENEQYWTDDSMYAKYDATTGAVLVYQIVNGQEVGMGWIPADKWIEGTKAATGNTEIIKSLNPIIENVVDSFMQQPKKIMENFNPIIENVTDSFMQQPKEIMENLKNNSTEVGEKIVTAGTTVLGAISKNNIKSINETETIGSSTSQIIEGENATKTITPDGDNGYFEQVTSNTDGSGYNLHQYEDENGNIRQDFTATRIDDNGNKVITNVERDEVVSTTTEYSQPDADGIVKKIEYSNGNVTFINTSGHKITYKADGSIVEEPF